MYFPKTKNEIESRRKKKYNCDNSNINSSIYQKIHNKIKECHKNLISLMQTFACSTLKISLSNSSQTNDYGKKNNKDYIIQISFKIKKIKKIKKEEEEKHT